jgi:hypothetical protein
MKKLALVLVAATVVLAACGGSSKSNGLNGVSNNGGTTKSGGGGNSGGNDEFSQLVANASKANIKITYNDQDGKPVTIAQDGHGKSSFSSGDSTFINDGKNSFSCSGTGTDQKCTQLPSAAASAGNLGTVFTSIFAGLTKLDKSVYGGHVSSDTIAGRDARCITFKASDFAGLAALGSDTKGYDPNAEATICVDKSTGFLLRLSSKSSTEDTKLFEATHVGEASDSDFTPPVTPETIPNITIPNYTIPSIPGYNP